MTQLLFLHLIPTPPTLSRFNNSTDVGEIVSGLVSIYNFAFKPLSWIKSAT